MAVIRVTEGYRQAVEYEFDPNEPYDRAENAYRTDGRDVCHWCASRPQEFIWGPFGTRTCSFCDDRIDAGDALAIADEVWARMKIRGHLEEVMDLEEYHRREVAMIERWLTVRTERRPLEPHELDD